MKGLQLNWLVSSVLKPQAFSPMYISDTVYCLHIWDFLFWKCSACGKFLRNSTGLMPKRKISSYHLYLSRQATLRVEVFKVFKTQVYFQLYILQWPQDWKRSVFIPIPTKGSAKECSNYHTIALSILAWKIPWTEEPGRLQSMGSLCVGHDWGTSLSLFTFLHWTRKWQPTPVFLPGESQGRGSLVGCRLWGRTESDTIEAT